jgi:hypothetical protein
MAGEETWDNAKPFRQLNWWLCEAKGCEQLTEHQVVLDRRTGEPRQWCCTRCHTHSGLNLPFSPTAIPDGREQTEAALKTLLIYAPILLRVDQARLYLIADRFFRAGWCVKDLLYAIDYQPTGDLHEGAELLLRDPGDITLPRIAARLRRWAWRDKYEDDKGGDVMPGPYTAMRNAMRVRHEEQQVRALSREIEWAEQERMAAEARVKDAPTLARRQVAIAQQLAKHRKRDGDEREAAALAEQVAWARGRSHMPTVDELASTYWANERSADVQREGLLGEPAAGN